MLAVSVLRDYTLIWKGDPALREDVDEAAWARAVAARDWSQLVRPGMSPTVFHVRHLPGALWRRLHDYVRDKAHGIGAAQFPALMFAMSVVSIEGYDGKVERVEHVDAAGKLTGLGLVLSPETMNALDTVPDMIATLGDWMFEARSSPNPL